MKCWVVLVVLLGAAAGVAPGEGGDERGCFNMQVVPGGREEVRRVVDELEGDAVTVCLDECKMRPCVAFLWSTKDPQACTFYLPRINDHMAVTLEPCTDCLTCIGNKTILATAAPTPPPAKPHCVSDTDCTSQDAKGVCRLPGGTCECSIASTPYCTASSNIPISLVAHMPCDMANSAGFSALLASALQTSPRHYCLRDDVVAFRAWVSSYRLTEIGKGGLREIVGAKYPNVAHIEFEVHPRPCESAGMSAGVLVDGRCHALECHHGYQRNDKTHTCTRPPPQSPDKDSARNTIVVAVLASFGGVLALVAAVAFLRRRRSSSRISPRSMTAYIETSAVSDSVEDIETPPGEGRPSVAGPSVP